MEHIYLTKLQTSTFDIVSILQRMNRIGKNNKAKYPIVIVPGNGGSQAYCQLKNSNSPPFPIWINMIYFWESSILKDYFRITSDSELGHIIFPGWGDTWSIENLDSIPHSFTSYCAPLIDMLKKDPYFISNHTIRGAPYDFRKAPKTYRNANSTPVVLLGHSLGTKYSLYFLKTQTYSWKKKYIKKLVFLSAPLGGSPKALKVLSFGDDVGVLYANSHDFRPVLRSMPSVYFLLPDTRLWSDKEVLISTPLRNYTVNDYKQLFKDMTYQYGYDMYLDSKELIDTLERPTGVDEIYCIHGTNHKTIKQLVYKDSGKKFPDLFDDSPTYVYGNGDGTVSLRSLSVCKNWSGVNYTVLPGAEHTDIIGDARFLDIMRDVLNAEF